MALKMVKGSSTTVISLAAALNNAAYTYQGLANCTHTLLDNSTDLYPFATAVLDIPDTFSAAPTADTVFNLWAIPQDVDSTLDVVPPADSTALKQRIFMGAFPIVAYDVRQTVWIPIDLHMIEKAYFNIENKCGVNASYSSGAITVKITPWTYDDV